MKRIRGAEEIIKELRAKHQSHADAMERGLKKAGLFILGKSMDIVPVDEGNLKASGFTRAKGKGFKCEVLVGYTASYAIYVHENLEARHGQDYNDWHGEEIAAGILHARGENQQAKFLEQPLREFRTEYVGIIRDEMENA